MRFRLTPALLLIASAVAAQPTTSLPRSAPGNGFTDSTLHTCIDSAGRTRACSIAQLRKVLPFANLDSMRVSLIPSAHDSSSRVAVTRYVDLAVSAAVHGVVDSATGATRAATLTTSRTLWGQSFNGSANVTGAIGSVGNITGTDSTWTIGGSATTLRPRQVWVADTVFSKKFCTAVATCLGASATVSDTVRAVTFDSVKATKVWAGDGTAAAPSIGLLNSRTSGLYRVGPDTLGIATGGVQSLRLSGGASPTLAGGAGNLTVLAGTGVSRTMTFQTTNASSTVRTPVRVAGDSLLILTGGATNGRLSGTRATFDTYSFASDASDVNIALNTADTIAFNTRASLGGNDVLWLTGDGTDPTLIGGFGSLKIQGGKGNSKGLVLRTTTSSGTATTAMRFNESQQALLAAGTAALPSLTLAADTNSGLYGFGPDTLGFSTGGALSLRLSGGATATLAGGAGNMTIQAGTGNARTLTLQTTNGSGAVKNTVVLGADTSATFLGSIIAADSVRFSKSVAAGVGDDYICRSSVGTLHDGATCAASTRLIKENINAYTSGLTAVLALKPVRYNFQSQFYGGRKDIHFLADEAAKVDSQFAFYAGQDQQLANGKTLKKGEAQAINDGAVVAALVSAVQSLNARLDAQGRMIDSLRAGLAELNKKPSGRGAIEVNGSWGQSFNGSLKLSTGPIDTTYDGCNTSYTDRATGVGRSTLVFCSPAMRANRAALTEVMTLRDTNVYTFPRARVLSDSAGRIVVKSLPPIQ